MKFCSNRLFSFFSGAGMGEPAFSNHGVWRPLVEEDDGVGDMYWLRWHGRDCRRRRHRSHGIVVVRRSKIQPSNFFAGTTRVAALCRHWWSPTKREMRMSVLPWRWLWKLFECNPCAIHASWGFSMHREIAQKMIFALKHGLSWRSFLLTSPL